MMLAFVTDARLSHAHRDSLQKRDIRHLFGTLCSLFSMLVLSLALTACGGSGSGNAGDGGSTGGTGSGAPQITVQPGGQSTITGRAASFSVTVTGSSPLSYQWMRNGVAITGETSATYTLPSTALADSGASFSVKISNSAGAATSSSADLTVAAASPGLNLYAGALGGAGNADGTGTLARFNFPQGIVADSSGNFYLADANNNLIRKITASGVVTTIAGTSGKGGSVDGTGSAARFNTPMSVAVGSDGNLYVTDAGNATIRLITPAGVVTTFAGAPGITGSTDGSGSAARFRSPVGIVADSSGHLYVADAGNNTIRMITSTGVVSTLAGVAGTSGSSDGTGTAALFNFPMGIARDTSGNLYISDTQNNTIRKMTAAGAVTTIAGSTSASGSSDGTGTAASFSFPTGITVDSSGNLYVADTQNDTIRKINSAGVVTTLAGQAGVTGSSDGTGNTALFNGPVAVAADTTGNVYVTDSDNCMIRKITSAGIVTTVAGTAPQTGTTDGAGGAARFHAPLGIALDAAGNLYVADYYGETIRKITQTTVVSTFAGSAGSPGTADGSGTSALFYAPAAVATDSSGNVYIADSGNHSIRKITSAGVVTTFAGTAGTYGSADGTGIAAQFNLPLGITTDSSGNVYVSDTQNDTIRKITSVGIVTTIAGGVGAAGTLDGTGLAARFDAPEGIAVDSLGNVYVADSRNSTIRKITPAGVVTTFAGAAGVSGSADGTGNTARFSNPASLAIDSADNLFVADGGNDTIRKITPAGVVTTVAGVPGVLNIVTGTLPGGLATPFGIAVDASGKLYVSSGNSILQIVFP